MSDRTMDPAELETIRVSFRANPHRDEAAYLALSKLPERAKSVMARCALTRALAAGLVTPDEFMHVPGARRRRPAAAVKTSMSPRSQPPTTVVASEPVPEAGRLSAEELRVMRALDRF